MQGKDKPGSTRSPIPCAAEFDVRDMHRFDQPMTHYWALPAAAAPRREDGILKST